MIDNTYVKVSAIYKKLKQAETENRVLFIYGAVAFGKTAAVEYYYRNKSHLLLSGIEGCLNDMPDISQIRQSIVIFDDISWITDVRSQEYITNMIRNRKKYGLHIVLIGRSLHTKWIRKDSVEQGFILADERDLSLNYKEVEMLLDNNQISPSQAEIKQMYTDSFGHPLTLIFMIQSLQKGKTYGPDVLEETRLNLFHYYDKAFYEKWDIDMREVLLSVCQYTTFTVEMIEMITNKTKIESILEKALNTGTFLTKHDDKTYSYRIHLKRYLQWKQAILYSKKQIADNFDKAALYYELQDNIELALYYYKKADNHNKISSLLIKNAERHPGTGHFFETRSFYFELPRETILNSPVLISGMSMLYALILQKEESDKWYEELVNFEKDTTKSTAERSEARIRIAYLNIALPHKGIHGIIQILKNTAVLIENKDIKLPEFSVTSNIPSIMNGGLDFCEWSRFDKELSIVMKKPVELVLGKHGVGLVNIAMSESGYEKATMSFYEMSTRLNTAFMLAGANGKIEMCFVATGLMVKMHLVNNQHKVAKNLLNSFYEKVQLDNATQLMPNLDTFKMWFSLMLGETAPAKEWLKTAPNENIAFCILDRYMYISKVRCLIALGEIDYALTLIERLNVYFLDYERNYMWMENQILKSICLYRMRRKEWKTVFTEVLKKSEHYHFIRIFSIEGKALEPLLRQYNNTTVNAKYYEQIKEETFQMAIYYPKYLDEIKQLEVSLTATESRILKMLCDGFTTEKICELCSFSYNSLKFHNRNIYHKLGVKNRKEAEIKAASLKLV